MSTEKKKIVLDENDLMKAAQTMKPTRYVPPPRPVGEQLPHYEFKSARPLMHYFPWKTLFVLSYLVVSAFFYYKYDEKSALNISQKSLDYVLTSNVLKKPWAKNPKLKEKLTWLQAEVSKKQKVHAVKETAVAGVASGAAIVPAAAAIPAPLVGQRFTYRYRLENLEQAVTIKDTTVVVELTAHQSGKLTWQDSEGGTSINTVNPFLPPLSYNGSSILPSTQNKIDGDPAEIWPLEKGKVVDYEVTTLITGKSNRYDYKCTVGHPLSTATAVGVLKTTRVDCASNEEKPTTVAFFFSSRMSHWVKQEMEFYLSGKKHALHVELVGFESAGRTPSSN